MNLYNSEDNPSIEPTEKMLIHSKQEIKGYERYRIIFFNFQLWLTYLARPTVHINLIDKNKIN